MGAKLMLTIKAALAGALAPRAVDERGLCRTQDQHAGIKWSEGSDAAAIAKLGEMFATAGGKWEQTSIAGHTANTLAKLRADVVAGNAPPAVQLEGPEDRRMERDGHDRQSRRACQQGGMGQGRRTRASAGDEADRRLGRRAPMNIHRINWIWGSTKAMEQRRRSNRCRRPGRNSTPTATKQSPRTLSVQPISIPGLDRRHDVRSGRLPAGYRSLPQGLRRRRHQRDALARNGQGV